MKTRVVKRFQVHWTGSIDVRYVAQAKAWLIWRDVETFVHESDAIGAAKSFFEKHQTKKVIWESPNDH